jgi:hypothetical protein
MGASTAKVLYNIQKGVVYRGAGTANAIYTLEGNRLYEGASTAKVIMNWTGDRLGAVDMFAAIMFYETRRKAKK